MSRQPAARASAWRFCFSLGGLRGKGVGRATITYSIFTLDPPRANAHSHRTRSDFAFAEYKVRLCMQQQNESPTIFFADRNGTSLILPSTISAAGFILLLANPAPFA